MPLSQYRQVLPFLRPHRRALLFILLVSLLATATGLAQPYLSKYLIDEALLRRDMERLLWAAAMMVGVTVAGFVFNIASSYHYTRISAQVLFAMRLDLYRHLQKLPPSFFVRTKMGDIVSRLNNDIAEVQRVFSDALLSLLSNLVFLAGSVAIMLSLSPALFAVSVAMLPLAFWALRRYQHRLAAHVKTMRERSADIGAFLIETLMGMRLVVSHAREEHEAERFRRHNQGFIDALLRMQYTSYLASALPGTALTLSTAAVFLYGGKQVIDGWLSVGGLVAFLAYHMRLLAPLQNLMSLYSSLVTGAVSLGRVDELRQAKIEVTEAPDAAAVAAPPASVEFRGVHFRHTPETPVLQGVSFTIPAGARCVLLGPSGAGKSTIADLLLRFFDPASGTVLVNGADARGLSLASLRSRIAVVEQTPILLHATVLENIRYGRPEATMEEVRDAARRAAIDGYVASLPLGYETVVGDRGLALSAGERQRIALARALLRQPSVLLLDEPTSALDPETERAIQTALQAPERPCTVIVITHRESFVELADLVLSLRNGQVETRIPARP